MEQEFNKAVEKFQAGQYKQAEKILLKLNKRQPGIPDVAHMLAYICETSGISNKAAILGASDFCPNINGWNG